jgi:hypothetical protein
MPKILSTNSVLKPFITDITTMSVATPNMIPSNENQADIEINPSTRLDLIYLKAIIRSVSLKIKKLNLLKTFTIKKIQ